MARELAGWRAGEIRGRENDIIITGGGGCYCCCSLLLARGAGSKERRLDGGFRAELATKLAAAANPLKQQLLVS